MIETASYDLKIKFSFSDLLCISNMMNDLLHPRLILSVSSMSEEDQKSHISRQKKKYLELKDTERSISSGQFTFK